MQYQWDYHIGGRMAYVNAGAVIIGGRSVDTAGGGIELFYGTDGEKEKWHRVVESDPSGWYPDVVKLPIEYKWFTITDRPHCFPWPHSCDYDVMLFGGYGCEDEDKNCDFREDSYVSSFGWDGKLDGYRSYTERNTNIDRLIPWEMTNVHDHRTIDSVLDRDSGYLVHAQVFNCKGTV